MDAAAFFLAITVFVVAVTVSTEAASYVAGSAAVVLGGAAKHQVGRRHAELAYEPTGAKSYTSVFYPAVPAAGAKPEEFDMKQLFPPVPFPDYEAADLGLPTQSFLDAPISPPPTGKKFPVVHFVHNPSYSHLLSLPILEHIAARGFIVVASDNPCNYMKPFVEGSLPVGFGGSAPAGCPGAPTNVEMLDFVRGVFFSASPPKPFTAELKGAALEVHFGVIAHNVDGIGAEALAIGNRGGEVHFSAQIMGYNPQSATALSNYVQLLHPDAAQSSQAQATGAEAQITLTSGLKWTATLEGSTKNTPVTEFCHTVWKNPKTFTPLLNQLSGIAPGLVPWVEALTQPCNPITGEGKGQLQATMTKISTALTASLVRTFGGTSGTCAQEAIVAMNNEWKASTSSEGFSLSDTTARRRVLSTGTPTEDECTKFDELPRVPRANGAESGGSGEGDGGGDGDTNTADNGGAIAGAVVGSLLGVGALAVGGVYLYKRRQGVSPKSAMKDAPGNVTGRTIYFNVGVAKAVPADDPNAHSPYGKVHVEVMIGS